MDSERWRDVSERSNKSMAEKSRCAVGLKDAWEVQRSKVFITIHEGGNLKSQSDFHFAPQERSTRISLSQLKVHLNEVNVNCPRL